MISFRSLKKGSLGATLYNMFGGSVIPLSHLSRVTLPQNKHKLFTQGGLEGLGTFPPALPSSPFLIKKHSNLSATSLLGLEIFTLSLPLALALAGFLSNQCSCILRLYSGDMLPKGRGMESQGFGLPRIVHDFCEMHDD